MTNRPHKIVWKRKMLEEEKAKVKDLIARQGLSDPKEALRYILAQASAKVDENDDRAPMRQFFWIMYGLIHNTRHGLLTYPEVRRLSKVARAVLLTEGINPTKSILAHLYGDLHQAMSQMDRMEGFAWRAAWNQRLGQYMSSLETDPEIEAFKLLTFANRAFRLGYGTLAIDHFRRAEEASQKQSVIEQARLARILALRCSGNREEASRLLRETETQFANASLETSLELRWEKIVAKVVAEGSLAPMAKAVSAQGSHYTGEFLVEASVWQHAVRDQDWAHKIQRLRNSVKNEKLSIRRAGEFLRIARAIEEITDSPASMYIRLERLGEELELCDRLVSVDQELLVLAAAGRWLCRVSAVEFARLVLQRYRALSLVLSDGANADALGVVGDLLQRPWMKTDLKDERAA